MTFRNFRHIFTIAVAASAMTAPVRAQDASKGGAIFAQRCTICHSADPAKPSGMGPNLAGVVGRKSGTRGDFTYSPAMKQAGLTWSKDTLDTFLSGPAKLVPGTRMPIAVPAPKDRADIIAYLAKQKAK